MTGEPLVLSAGFGRGAVIGGAVGSAEVWAEVCDGVCLTCAVVVTVRGRTALLSCAFISTAANRTATTKRARREFNFIMFQESPGLKTQRVGGRQTLA